jgi:hypothetical protein
LTTTQPSQLTADRLLRHVVAALAYRATRTLENAPEQFAAFSAGAGVWTPKEILSHVSRILGIAHARLTGGQYAHDDRPDWPAEVDRFYAALARLDQGLAGGVTSGDDLTLRMVQGPLLDAFTHVGQLATLRRLAGSPVAPDHYIKADVRIGRVGKDQPPPIES